MTNIFEEEKGEKRTKKDKEGRTSPDRETPAFETLPFSGPWLFRDITFKAFKHCHRKATRAFKTSKSLDRKVKSEEDKRATTYVQNGLVFLFLFSFILFYSLLFSFRLFELK